MLSDVCKVGILAHDFSPTSVAEVCTQDQFNGFLTTGMIPTVDHLFPTAMLAAVQPAVGFISTTCLICKDKEITVLAASLHSTRYGLLESEFCNKNSAWMRHDTQVDSFPFASLKHQSSTNVSNFK